MRKALNHLRKSDPILARMIDAVGPYRLEQRPPEFSTLARSIVYQQLSGKAAGTILRRLVEAAGELNPDSILRLRPQRMRALGLSTQKTAYLRDLARMTRSGELDFAQLPSLPDEEVIARLTAVKGIGVWTAQMFLMFALERHDVFPAGDLGVRNAMQRAYGLEAPPKPLEMERMAEPWRPWRSVASWYLWRSIDGDAQI
jgi:DNA-3-methyladenine glycosylase II